MFDENSQELLSSKYTVQYFKQERMVPFLDGLRHISWATLRLQIMVTLLKLRYCTRYDGTISDWARDNQKRAFISSLYGMTVTSVTKGWTQKLPKQILGFSKHTDMTIHLKALEEHLLMVYTISFLIHPFGEIYFLNSSQTNLSL
jgi:hypothetical protein